MSVHIHCGLYHGIKFYIYYKVIELNFSLSVWLYDHFWQCNSRSHDYESKFYKLFIIIFLMKNMYGVFLFCKSTFIIANS